MQASVVIRGLSAVSVCVASDIVEKQGRGVILVSLETPEQAARGEQLAHVVGQARGDELAAKYLHDQHTARRIMAVELGEGTSTIRHSVLVNPRQLLLDTYHRLTNYTQLFVHHIVPPQVYSLDHCCKMFPTVHTIINCHMEPTADVIRLQSVLLYCPQELDTAYIHKSAQNQYTRLTPLVQDPRVVVLTGPHQHNDAYPLPRDSDEQTLLWRSRQLYPHVVAQAQILDSEVIFKPGFGNQHGKIYATTTVDGRTVVHTVGFGFHDIDALGAIVHAVRVLAAGPLDARL
ncbi:hypothetical protein KL918_002036 [Ogataea parapolymorpha]|nr:hypothetical protein KL918_002036 [Ogataea parapolymorpha]KAG7871398.1 hypothetical protein KL916_003978 [Ogataea parapolymorpha]